MTSTRNTATTITVVSVFLLTTHHLTCRPSGHPAQRTGHPAGYFGPGCTFYALASFRAAAAGHALVLDDLAIKVVLGLDNAAKEHPAVYAGAGTLEASVVCLYGVVMVAGLRYSVGVHRAPPLWAGLRGVASTCGAISFSDAPIIQHLSEFCLVKYGDRLYNLRMKYGVCTTPDMEVNVQRLRTLRTEHVLTLRELAEAAGVSKDTIWRLENGHSDAHPSTIRKLAKALEVQPKELVKTGA